MTTSLHFVSFVSPGTDIARRAIAAFLGKNPDVVSYWVRQGVRSRGENLDFAHRLDFLGRALKKKAVNGETSAKTR